jgi:hypothetical protein
MTDTATLITQLRILGHLTRTEAQVARLRVAQATGDDVRAELRHNAHDADGRAGRIAGVLRDLGALPDPVTPVLGRVAVLVRGALEQTQPLDEALLGDLVLEHQLRDRARYVGALADAAGLPAVRALADDLDAAHTQTVDWLSRVLAGLAGGAPALGATPLQKVAEQVTRAANTPSKAVLDGAGAAVTQVVTRAANTVTQAGGEVRQTVVGVAGKAAEVGGQVVGVAGKAAEVGGQVMGVAGKAAEVGGQVGGQIASVAASAGGDTLKVGRDAAGAAEGLARRLIGTAHPGADAEPEQADADQAGPDQAGSDQAEPERAGSPQAEPGPAPEEDRPLPVPGFADLPPHAAVAALRSLDDPRDVDAMLAFEQAHGDRPPVIAAARIRAAAVGAAGGSGTL